MDQMAQESLNVPRSEIFYRNIKILKYFYNSRGFVQDNYPAEQVVESSERRQDSSDLELESLLMKERQLQVI